MGHVCMTHRGKLMMYVKTGLRYLHTYPCTYRKKKVPTARSCIWKWKYLCTYILLFIYNSVVKGTSPFSCKFPPNKVKTSSCIKSWKSPPCWNFLQVWREEGRFNQVFTRLIVAAIRRILHNIFLFMHLFVLHPWCPLAGLNLAKFAGQACPFAGMGLNWHDFEATPTIEILELEQVFLHRYSKKVWVKNIL
jgi:hypothetical protein